MSTKISVSWRPHLGWDRRQNMQNKVVYFASNGLYKMFFTWKCCLILCKMYMFCHCYYPFIFRTCSRIVGEKKAKSLHWTLRTHINVTSYLCLAYNIPWLRYIFYQSSVKSPISISITKLGIQEIHLCNLLGYSYFQIIGIVFIPVFSRHDSIPN